MYMGYAVGIGEVSPTVIECAIERIKGLFK
jgi:hypothetical protein